LKTKKNSFLRTGRILLKRRYRIQEMMYHLQRSLPTQTILWCYDQTRSASSPVYCL